VHPELATLRAELQADRNPPKPSLSREQIEEWRSAAVGHLKRARGRTTICEDNDFIALCDQALRAGEAEANSDHWRWEALDWKAKAEAAELRAAVAESASEGVSKMLHDSEAEREYFNQDGLNQQGLRYREAQRADNAEMKVAALEQQLEAMKQWLDSNTTHYDPRVHLMPSLAAERIWYHATDDTESFPFSKVIDAARSPDGGEG
jgi:hypothetical protein